MDYYLHESRSTINYKSTDTNSYTSSLPSYPLFNNDVQEDVIIETSESTDFISVSAPKPVFKSTNLSTSLPLFFHQNNTIKIPSKIEYVLRRYTPRKLLYAIHKDIDVAVEHCLLLTTQLIDTYFKKLTDPDFNGWKSLQAKHLRSLISISPNAYKCVIDALTYPLDKGPIIERDDHYEPGIKCYHYRISSSYIQKGIVDYELKTEQAITSLNRNLKRLYENAVQNIICRNLIHFYTRITFPTLEEIILEAKKLIKNGYITKKGKKLKFRNKHSRGYFKNPESISFVEDAIDLFEYLTKGRLLIPTVGRDNSGGRVVDSFSLMPSWIRSMIKIDGKPYTECDYSCLHPNIALSIYGGKTEFLTHKQIANDLNIDLSLVKKEHLSFFNKQVSHMKNSSVYSWYQKNELSLLEKIIKEKYNDEFKHKATSRRMFKKEVEIMMQVIEKLNQENIYVGYVYDALFCEPRFALRVKEVMDEIIMKLGVKTIANITYPDKTTWLPVKNYEAFYEISNTGQIRSLHKLNYGYIMDQRIDRAGYPTIRLNKPGLESSTVYIHRLMGFAFIPNPDQKLFINHKNGDKLDYSIPNLEWCTPSENMKHAYQTGLSKVPGKNKRGIIDICSKVEFPSISDAAKALSINYATCKNYLNGKRPNPTCLRYLSDFLQVA